MKRLETGMEKVGKDRKRPTIEALTMFPGGIFYASSPDCSSVAASQRKGPRGGPYRFVSIQKIDTTSFLQEYRFFFG